MTRDAQPEPCPRCNQPTLVGPDDDTAALTIRADPNPLTPTGEARALLAGRATYTLRQYAGRTVLTRRDHWTIAAQPADRIHVIADHSCDSDSIHDHARTPTPQPNPRQETQGEFPF